MGQWLRAAMHCPISHWTWKGKGTWPDVMMVTSHGGFDVSKRKTRLGLVRKPVKTPYQSVVHPKFRKAAKPPPEIIDNTGLGDTLPP